MLHFSETQEKPPDCAVVLIRKRDVGVNVSQRRVSACELQDPTACATFGGPRCPCTFHTPTSLCVTPPHTRMHHRVTDI